jgi:hypothetical protein
MKNLIGKLPQPMQRAGIGSSRKATGNAVDQFFQICAGGAIVVAHDHFHQRTHERQSRKGHTKDKRIVGLPKVSIDRRQISIV